MSGDNFDSMCREVAAQLNNGAWRATTGPRLSIIYEGVEAVLAQPTILNAYRVLYEDYLGFRLCAVPLFHIFLQVLRAGS